MTAQEILTAALALPEAERMELAQRLYESMADAATELFSDPNYLAMLERRCRDVSNTVPWSEVRQELDRIIDRCS